MVRRITKGKMTPGENTGIEDYGKRAFCPAAIFDRDGVQVATLMGDVPRLDADANAQLYALAHNTANELYDLGYDAEEVFKGLPETLARIERLEQLAIQYRDDLLRPPSDDSLERRLDAVNAEISQ